MGKKMLTALLCVIFLLQFALPVCAEEPESQEPVPAEVLRIATAEEFIDFARHCRLDSYSRGLTVILENDIDFSEKTFVSVPIFSGTFKGNGHTVSGVSITGDGSAQGFFRYLTDTAVVQNLRLKGDIHPKGSRNEIGALAGQNEGMILKCSFSGTVSGGDYAGGLVGRNRVTGRIEECRVSGEIYANHFVGGIAGENSGVIRGCTNDAQINTTPQQNDVAISDITLDTLTETEAANTVTDIGGIAGISSGVIRKCKNTGSIGYRNMGYNIGGIAGTQSGYLADCENYGSVQGRKEVGGIVGQMEPAALIEYSEDTLQILQGQLDTMTGLVNQASGNARTNANQLGGQLVVLQEQTYTVWDAADTLAFALENPELMDPDTVLAAQNTLSATLGDMPGTLQGIGSAAYNTVSGLSRDLEAVSAQIGAMGETIRGASDNLGGSIVDISDQDTVELLTGKVAGCANYGDVLADLNAGGIAGAMAMENDLDILEDWEQYGQESMNFESKIRAVIRECENYGTVTAKKQNAGGTVGWQPLGLVRDCTNVGRIDAENASYVGGISGLSAGCIRSCFAKCRIDAHMYVGGIAGSGTVVTDCISMVQLLNAAEKRGAILGMAEQNGAQEERPPICANYYPLLSEDIGAIDGISYAGFAEGMDMDAFLAWENLPDMFRTVAVRFVFEDGSRKQISLRPDESLSTSRIPDIPEKDGFTAKWADLDEADLENIFCDLTFEVCYTPYRGTIQSAATRDNARPLLLAEGSFSETAEIAIEEADTAPAVEGKDALLEAWTIHAPEGTQTLRFLLPEEPAEAKWKLLLRGEDGVWREAAYIQDGSYLVFAAAPGECRIGLVQVAESLVKWQIAGVSGAVILTAALLLHRRKKRLSVKAENQTAASE